MVGRIIAHLRRCCRLRFIVGVFIFMVTLQMSVYTFFTSGTSEDKRQVVDESWDEPGKMLVRNIRSERVINDEIDPSELHKIHESILNNNQEISLQVENHESVIKFNPAENVRQDFKPPGYPSHSDLNKNFDPQRLDSDGLENHIRSVDHMDGAVPMETIWNQRGNAAGIRSPPRYEPGRYPARDVGAGVIVNDLAEQPRGRAARRRSGDASLIQHRDTEGDTRRPSRRADGQRDQRGPPSYKVHNATGIRGHRLERDGVELSNDRVETKVNHERSRQEAGEQVGARESPQSETRARQHADVIIYRQWDAKNKTTPIDQLGKHILPTAPPRPPIMWDKIPVMRQEPPTSGRPWPEPVCFATKRDTYRPRMRITGDDFRFRIQGPTCKVLDEGAARYATLIQTLFPGKADDLTRDDRSAVWAGDGRRRNRPTNHNGVVWEVELILEGQECGDYPYLEMNESYSLHVNSSGSWLRAPEVWGLLRGMETFTQLIHKQTTRHRQGDMWAWFILQTACDDWPRYPHRGILIDTSRHFLSVDIILKNMDAMEMNKFNVLHWHIVDDQSFPYQSRVFPDLSDKGSYGPKYVYSPADIRRIVEYGRLRGIRVIPEFDSPGHTESWEKGMPGLLSQCPGGHLGPVNPVKQGTYEFFEKFFQEAAQLFPDDYFHLGGDESGFYCWSTDPNITNAMDRMGMIGDFNQLFGYYVHRLQGILRNSRIQAMKSIVWQEVFEKGTKIPKDSIVQFWKDDYRILKNITANKIHVIFSSCWYLNYIKYGADWREYYMCDPVNFLGRDVDRSSEYVVGGEACMWGEFIDDSNLLTTLWPRACAVAERLWSPVNLNSMFYWTERRYEEQRCRMLRRGIPTSPTSGPSPPCDDYS